MPKEKIKIKKDEFILKKYENEKKQNFLDVN